MQGTWLGFHKLILPPRIKHIVFRLGHIECCNLYNKYVNNDDKLKSKVLTGNDEATNQIQH